MNLLELLQDQLSGPVVDQLSKTIRADKEQTANAAEGVFATLVSALSRNAAKPEAGSALMNALDRDHDGSILNDVMGMLGGAQPTAKANNGMGILDHILGGKADNVVQMISKTSGLNFLQSSELMKLLAPMVMGTLGKAKQQSGFDLGGLSQILTGSVQQASQKREGMSLIEKVLDADGDGNIMDDLAGMGMKVLGGFFRK
ncbi:MAG: DUF937 domain-containing protein [Saprospiraceae bacterium]|nr:DUF937 domain-containing protein [Saprospiraceae bacterium]